MTDREKSPCQDPASWLKPGEWLPAIAEDNSQKAEDQAVGPFVRALPLDGVPSITDAEPWPWNNQKVIFFHNEGEAEASPAGDSSRHMRTLPRRSLERLADFVPTNFTATPPLIPRLLVRRTWVDKDSKKHPTHREARAVDVWLVDTLDEAKALQGPNKNTKLSVLLPTGTQPDFVLIRVEKGNIFWRDDGSQPSAGSEGNALAEGHHVGFGKTKIPAAWLRTGSDPTVSVVVRSCFLRNEKEDVGKLGCLAEQSGFEFVLHYSEKDDNLQATGIHGSMRLGNLSRLTETADWDDLEKRLGDVGWRGLLEAEVFDREPFIVFPGDEMLVPSVQIVPVRPRAGLTVGEVLLETAWSRGLTPRPVYLSQEDRLRGRLLLPFVHAPTRLLPGAATQPTTVDTLQKAIGPEGVDGTPFSTCKEGELCRKGDRGKQLYALIKELTIKESTEKKQPPYHGVTIQAHKDLLPQWVCIPRDAALPDYATLTNIMDTIAAQLLATWDWYGPDRIVMIPLPGYGFSNECFGEGAGRREFE